MISVIILNYNTFELTSQCIRSIYTQTKRVEFEIVLVDNASTDCNPDKFLEQFPKITLIKNTENRGFSKGCNDGIVYAKGDVILLLNSDTILLNDAISICKERLDSDSNIGVCTCRLENQDASPQNNCQRFPSVKLALSEKLRIHKLYSSKKRGKIWFGPYFNYNEIAYPDWVWGTFFMFPHKTLEVFPEKKLTETFWIYVEDVEWCWLIRKAGKNVTFVPDACVRHLGGINLDTIGLNHIKAKNYKKFISNNYPLIIRQLILWFY